MKMNREALFRKIRKVLPVIFFLYVLFLYFSLLSEPYFTDEQESFVGAYSVIKGKELYSAFQCQHMPFSYYIAVPIALCGARTVLQFRMGIYVMLSILWEGIYVRHRRWLRPESLFSIPLLYLTALKTLHMGTAMLADHWQGMGWILILLEILRYTKEKRITRSCAGMAALGIFFSLGFSFASAYALLCFFLAILVMQCKWIRDLSRNQEKRKTEIRRLLWEDARLVLLSAAPFAVLLGYYLLCGNLENFYISCFKNVTQVYSQYTDGLGSNPVSVLWTTVREYGNYLLRSIQSLPAHPWPHLLYLLFAAGSLGVAWKVGRMSRFAGVLVFFAVIYSGLRGYEGFHSIGYYALTSAALVLCLERTVQRVSAKAWQRWTVKGILCAAEAVFLVQIAVWGGYNLLYPQALLDRTKRCEEEMLDLLTEREEEVFVCNMPISSLDVMDLELVPKENSFAIIYPFFYSAWGDRQMASIQDHPHVVLYNPEEVNAGARFCEYAPDFDAYMKSHYIRLPQAETMWVSEAYYPEALRRLKGAGYGDLVVSNTQDSTRNHPVQYLPGQSVTATFTAEHPSLAAVRFCGACFHRRSNPALIVRLREQKTGTVIAEATMTGENIADNHFSRCPLTAKLTPGEKYEMEFSITKIDGKGDMEFYFTPENVLSLAEEYQVSP